MKTKVNERQKGITLIALVITIIVLLILAGVSIAMLTGDNGILNQANDSKIETAVGTVKEQLKLLQGEKIIQGEKVTPETLLAEGKVKRTVRAEENDKYYMYYALKENSLEGMQGLGKGDLTSLKDVFLIDYDLNVRYIASNGKEYGDQISKKILEDETEIRFSSKAFSEYVSKISGVAEGEMKFKWMKNQTSLIISDPKVDSLQDLVFFPNLTSLEIGNDYSGKLAPNITTMDGIENCNNLVSLTIIQGPNKNYKAMESLEKLENFTKFGGEDYENIINSIKFCDNLKNLEIRNQKIENMKIFSELTALEVINLSGCSIEKIEGLSNMKKLRILHLYNNNISKIEGLKGLDNLIEIKLTNNKISKIEGLEEAKKLQYLYLDYNKISDIIPLSANNSLIYLNLTGNPEIDGNRSNYKEERLEALNKIGEILDRGGSINLDADKLALFTNHKKINLNNNNLTTLDNLDGITEVTNLLLSNNSLTLEDEKSQNILKSMTKLQLLNLDNNKITNIRGINELKELKNLYLVGKNNIVDLSQIEDIISNLNVLTVSTETLKTIQNCDVGKITILNIQGSGLTEIPDLSKFTNLSKVNLGSNPSIANFDRLSNLTSLTNLLISNNNLHGRMIDFTKLTNLVYLDLSNNTLWSEDLENLKVLKNNTNLTINLENNSIINATALLELNPSTKIKLKGNVNLSQESKDKLKERFGNNVSF